MRHDIRFIRLDDDLTEALNRQADETNQRVSEMANELIRLQLFGRAHPLRSAAAGVHGEPGETGNRQD